MKNLTECDSYEDIIQCIKERGWSSSQVASKCWHYHQNIGIAKTEATAIKRQKVYDWLCQYQQEFHVGNLPSEHKSIVVERLKNQMTVNEVFDSCQEDGIVIAKSTIYKYSKELKNEL